MKFVVLNGVVMFVCQIWHTVDGGRQCFTAVVANSAFSYNGCRVHTMAQFKQQIRWNSCSHHANNQLCSLPVFPQEFMLIFVSHFFWSNKWIWFLADKLSIPPNQLSNVIVVAVAFGIECTHFYCQHSVWWHYATHRPTPNNLAASSFFRFAWLHSFLFWTRYWIVLHETQCYFAVYCVFYAHPNSTIFFDSIIFVRTITVNQNNGKRMRILLFSAISIFVKIEELFLRARSPRLRRTLNLIFCAHAHTQQKL